MRLVLAVAIFEAAVGTYCTAAQDETFWNAAHGSAFMELSDFKGDKTAYKAAGITAANKVGLDALPCKSCADAMLGTMYELHINPAGACYNAEGKDVCTTATLALQCETQVCTLGYRKACGETAGGSTSGASGVSVMAAAAAMTLIAALV